MNNEHEHFEKRVSGLPLRAVPAEWREEILAAARAAQTVPSPAARVSFLSTLNTQLMALLWPHPKAWAGLAAVWVGIMVLNFASQDTTPKLAEGAAAPSPALVVELKKQQRMFAELVGGEAPDVDRPRIFSPRPRSGRGEAVAV